MTTLEKVKDQVAQRMGFGNWKRFINFVNPTDEIVDEVAKLYANAKLDEAADKALVNKQYLSGHNCGRYSVINHLSAIYTVDKESILKLKDQV